MRTACACLACCLLVLTGAPSPLRPGATVPARRAIVLSAASAPDAETGTAAEAAPPEDLGGAFSGRRAALSVRITLIGLGTVFASLALLWLVLLLFGRILSRKREAPPDGPEGTPAGDGPPASPEGPIDPAVAAAIAAAVAETIASDEEAAPRFQSGFRVAVFRKGRGRSSWNG